MWVVTFLCIRRHSNEHIKFNGDSRVIEEWTTLINVWITRSWFREMHSGEGLLRGKELVDDNEIENLNVILQQISIVSMIVNQLHVQLVTFLLTLGWLLKLVWAQTAEEAGTRCRWTNTEAIYISPSIVGKPTNFEHCYLYTTVLYIMPCQQMHAAACVALPLFAEMSILLLARPAYRHCKHVLQM